MKWQKAWNWNNESKDDKAIFYIKLVTVFVAVVGLLIYIYTEKLNKIVMENTLLAVEEAAINDRHTIKNYVEFFLSELKGVGMRLEMANCTGLQMLKKQLNLERISTPFSRLFLLTKTGRTFSDNYLVFQPGNGPIGKRFNFENIFAGPTEDQLVFRFDDDSEFADISHESVLYAIKLNGFKIGEEEFTTLIGLADIHILQERMILEGFSQNGINHSFSSVISKDGAYIVGEAPNKYLDNDTNFFTQLAQAKDISMEAGEIRERMDKLESFHLLMTDANGKELVYFIPFMDKKGDSPEWYFLTMVNNNYMEERQQTFLGVALSLLGLVGLILCILFIYTILTRNRLHMANEAVRVRSEFLSNMSHEIRSPLNGLIGLNRLIANHIKNPAKIRQIMDWLNKSQSLEVYLLALLDDILNMASIRTGNPNLQLKPLAISTVIDTLEHMHEESINKKHLNFIVEKDLPYDHVIGDEVRLKQILTNIIDNAIKFTPENGKITLKVFQHKMDVNQVLTTFICEDKGIGIKPELLKKIFHPFVQDRTSSVDHALKGTGLGLTISSGLVDAMGGTIEVESYEGKGTILTITIPFVISTEVPETTFQHRSAIQKHGKLLRKKKRGHFKLPEDAPVQPDSDSSNTIDDTKTNRGEILLAEDAEFNAEFLIELLTDQGYTVAHARNGKEAVEIFNNSSPGEFPLILMDLQMPVMDGCEATYAIRNLQRGDAKTVLIYACTANVRDEDKNRAMKSGMNDFVTKPIDINLLMDKINETFLASFEERSNK